MNKIIDKCGNSVIIALVSVILTIVYFKYFSREHFSDYAPFENTINEVEAPAEVDVPLPAEVVSKPTENKSAPPVPFDADMSTEMQLDNQEATKVELPSCASNGSFVSSNLLPKTKSGTENFSEFAPEASNFVDSSKFVIGAVSQSNRNANLQLRSEPANPRSDVCPWMQSTINQDTDRKKMEIGN
jgi:hypothetical protein